MTDSIYDEPESQMYRAILNGNVVAARQLLAEHPESRFLHYYVIGRTWLHHAAEHLELAKIFVDAGIDVNAPCENDDSGPLYYAVHENIDVARFLLERGVDPNQGRALIAAANEGSLELVKLLVDYGADVNKCYPDEFADGQPMNALGQAIAYGYTEIEEYLRSLGAVEPEVPTPKRPGATREEILQHMSQHLGLVQQRALREVVPGDPSIDINVIHPVDDEDCVTLLTTGMSDRAMAVPEGYEEYQYAELKINLPRDWPLSDEALGDPNHRWPIEWLRRIAYYPHENDTWLGGASTIIANDEPPQPFAPNTKLSCMLLLMDDTPTGRIECSDGKLVMVYSLYPLYHEERDIELKHGIVHLVDLLQKHNIPSWVTIDRPNVADLENE